MILLAPDFMSDRGKLIAENLGIPFSIINTRIFPNGEVLARINDVKLIQGDKKIILYFSTYPDTNNRIFLLLESLESIRYYSPESEITLVTPYLSYSRQDKRFLEGESLSLKLYLDILKSLDVNRLIVFDVHSEDSFRKLISIPYINITLFNELVTKVTKIHGLNSNEYILVAPDEGRLETVRSIAKNLGSEHTYLKKFRDRYSGKIKITVPDNVTSPKDFKYSIILDDEISTGGTMAAVARYLKNIGVNRVIACAIHMLLINNADERLFRSGVDYLYGTNTVENPYSIVFIEDLIPKYI